MAAKWTIKLACGHRSLPMSLEMQRAVSHDGWTDCQTCGDSVKVAGSWRYGGLTIKQTEAKLARLDAHEAFRPGAPKIHKNGMATVQTGPRAWAWWCRRCEGYNPPKKGYVRSIDQARQAFAAHEASPLHARHSSPALMQAWEREQATRAALVPFPSKPVVSRTRRANAGADHDHP